MTIGNDIQVNDVLLNGYKKLMTKNRRPKIKMGYPPQKRECATGSWFLFQPFLLSKKTTTKYRYEFLL